MSIPQELYPSQDDLPYEEELLRNPFSLKLWWRYLVARTDSPHTKRFTIYERALKALPGSYKLWYAFLRERLELVRPLPITHREYQKLNNTFERALVTMHKMPRIWIMYLLTLTEQKLVTKTRRTFDRALCSLPVTQHDRVWDPYLVFVSQRGVPIETSLRVYRRYLKYDPSHIEDFIEFLVIRACGKRRGEHADVVSGLNVDAIIRGGIRKFTDEVGRLWTALADYYIRRELTEKARDVFEEGMTTVVTVRDFSVIFDAYAQFEETVLLVKMEGVSEDELDEGEGNGEEDEDEDDDDEDDRLHVAKIERKLKRFWLSDDKEVELRMARVEYLLDRRPELANSVLLRQNPHNVEQWHRRVKLFELYEDHKDVVNARVIFDKAVQVNYKTVDNLASVWCEWAEMELRHKNFKGALELMRRATAEPSVEVKRRVAADGNEPVQIKLHKSLRLWAFYVDLEESLGTLESTRTVYERILDLRIATPQIIINYAMLLEEHKYFEDAFKVYERGVKIFKYPHVKDIWVTYLSKFVKRYGKSKLERARDCLSMLLK
ncbi:hypothetical protein C3L33_06288, partial [Rhododendron williamsianum]